MNPEKTKQLICSSCLENLEGSEFLQCDNCKAIVCEGVTSGSCWHNHLISEHDIDWSIAGASLWDEEYIDSLRTEVEKK